MQSQRFRGEGNAIGRVRPTSVSIQFLNLDVLLCVGHEHCSQGIDSQGQGQWLGLGLARIVT